MSRFFSEKYKALTPYVPGEQPKDAQYIKLNTNESPFSPPVSVAEATYTEAERLQLYSDPENAVLTKKVAEVWGVSPSQVLMTNGSDEGLNFAFMAFCDQTHPIIFPDITYGFYPVFARLNGIPYQTVPLKEDFSLDYRDYLGVHKNIVIANPNAPTSLGIPLWQIEEIVKSNADNVVVIDEAYVDFGGESAVSLIDKYDNLLVTQTFSKSRSLAGARLGMVFGNEKLIADLNTVKYSTNPYNVNRMTAAAGYAVLCEREWFETCRKEIMQNREYATEELRKLGFSVLSSSTNFLFAKSDKVSGKVLYKKLRERGILIRRFDVERICEYLRITVGTKAQMQALIENLKEILAEEVK